MEMLSKPPLTRRWTRIVFGATRREPQTSAHAEMDLLFQHHNRP